MIGRREFMTKTFKAIVGGTLILPIPKVLYSFPTNIVLPEWYTINAYNNWDFEFFATDKIKLFSDRLNRFDASDEVVRLLAKYGIYDNYTSWYFHKVDTPPGEVNGFIWSGSVTDMAKLHRREKSIEVNPTVVNVELFDKTSLAGKGFTKSWRKTESVKTSYNFVQAFNLKRTKGGKVV